MNYSERKMLAEAAVPLEVLCGQIRHNPYKEMTKDFQEQLLNSLEIIRGLLFKQWIGNIPTHCQLCGDTISDTFIDGMISTEPYRYIGTVTEPYLPPPGGPWGIMCSACHQEHGCGLGEGKGQKYQHQGDGYVKVA